MADKTNLDHQKLKAALDKFMEIGLRQRKNWLEETQLRQGNSCMLVYISSP
jgi:hypothetical protein